MKFNQLRYSILLISSLLFCYCGGKHSAEDSAEMFSFDKALIGVDVSDENLGIKFNPPIDWELMPSSLSKKMEMRISPSDGFTYQPVYVFFNKSNSSVLSGGLVTSNDSSASANSILNFYKGLLSSKYKNSNLVLNTFIHSRISFNQIKFDLENLTAYKLFFQNSRGEIVQLEYSFRKDSLASVLPEIKASIGSIRLIN
ncbi:MAG: hypothetical protein FD143_360 [Ignavibacteria bacterium]|nr:MAG: hypothetical protein FD143_360 [Ignavibacteria bacterium]KAF0161952.1 MAG: hypothetical protein FD188_397 [Ignavibacteria bacterium]